MGIGAITSTGGMSFMQPASTDLKDQKSKSIQTEITEVQQQLQKLSSEEGLSANEKADERKKLQKEKSSLDTELKQHQEELLRSQKREAMLAELRGEQDPIGETGAEDEAAAAEPSANTAAQENPPTDGQSAQALQPGSVITQNSDGTVILKEVMNPAKTSEESGQTRQADAANAETTSEEETKPEDDDTDADPVSEFRPTATEMQAMVSADTSSQLADRMGTLVTKTDDGIAVLKGEIKQDTLYGTDTERKQAELEKMQKQRQREMAVQFSMLGDADNAMKAAVDTESTNRTVQADAGKHFQVSGLNVPQDEQTAQQGFHVSIA